MVWFRGTLDCSRAQFSLDEQTFLRHLQDIRDHGFDRVSLAEPTRPLLQRALVLARRAGFSKLVLQQPYPPDVGRSDLDGFDVALYVSDEIDQRGRTAFDAHRANARVAERLGLKTMMSIVRERFVAQMSALALGPRPDLVSVYLPSNGDFFRASAAFSRLRGDDTMYYWMASMEKPNVHRVLAGLYVWRSGAAGISPYCYQHLPRFPFDPYDDFDEWEPGSTVGTDGRPLKDQLATYPARNGSVPTLQWEGMREGLTDLRYLATVEDLLAQARDYSDSAIDPIRRDVEDHLRAIANATPLAPIRIADDAVAEPYPHLDARDYARFRRMLADDAVALTRALSSARLSEAVDSH